MAKENLNKSLFEAIKESNAEAVKSAIAAGADVNAKDDDGNMPLTLCNSAEIMKTLINAGADVNAKSDSGWAPLLEHSNDPELVKVLIDAGADIHAKTKFGQSILHTCRNADLVKMLIDAGADVNAKDNDGNTPLHNRPDLSVAKLLIAAGADVNAKNAKGKIPQDVCLVAAVKKLLIKAAEAKDNAASTDIKPSTKKKAEPKFKITEYSIRNSVMKRLDKVTLPKSFDGVLVIPEGVTQLGKLICQNMTQIKEVVLPENLLYLGNCTFAGCDNLEKINIPKGIQDLANSCFDGCTSLTELRIPAGARISGSNFVGLPSSTHIIIDEANPNAKIEEGAILSKDDKEFIRLLSDVENYEVKDSVTEIGGDAFNKRQNIKKIVLPASVKVIYNDFKGCPNLTTIVVKSETVRDKVKKILDEHELDIDIELIEDKNASHPSTEEEALFAAIEEGNVEAVKSAIAAGANVNAKDEDGGAAKNKKTANNDANNNSTNDLESETIHPFIIEIETLKDNVKFKCVVNSSDCDEKDIEYEALCSDSKKVEYKTFKGDFTHSFKLQGKYRISFKGKLPGLYFEDGKSYRLTDVCQWGDICWLSMDSMFSGCKYFNISASDQPDLSHVHSLSNMFNNAESMNAPLEKWDVSNITDMWQMFCGAKSFNQPLEKWNVSNVTNMKGMFVSAKSFNQPLEKWNVSNVTDMEGIFNGAESFNQPLEKWDVSNVTNMCRMFSGASSFNQPLEKWNVSNVTTMSDMFSYAKSFNQPLEKWDVLNVTRMNGMFEGTESFNQPIEKWDVSNVTDMEEMFEGAEAMNKLPSWLKES